VDKIRLLIIVLVALGVGRVALLLPPLRRNKKLSWTLFLVWLVLVGAFVAFWYHETGRIPWN